MGRTGRKRAKKKQHEFAPPLNHEKNIIELRKFMSRNGFNDENNLKLCNFPQTGRGVAAVKTLNENDVLITVPCNLMITYATLKSVNFLHMFSPTSKMTIHDLLATFLVVEKHKISSFWADYINSLPLEPPWLPALLSETHIELLPSDLRLATKKSRRLLEESWARIKRSIKNDWRCFHCGKKAGCVIDFYSFTWGYILVNTRAVYVDPQVIRGLCDWSDILSDEPCMALCPFLDMFNHSHKARSQAELAYQDGKLVYRLSTLTKYKKYEQVFISYGDHDNVRLLTEYGFFIPGNCHDCVSFTSEEVFKVLELSFADFQYKFISRHGLNTSLSICDGGPSFNLKGLLFVAENTVKNVSSVVFTDTYPEDFLKSRLKEMCQKLLSHELNKCLDDLKVSKLSGLSSLILDFLDYRLDFIKKLRDNKQ